MEYKEFECGNNKNLYSAVIQNRTCILIPFPHVNMGHNFLLKWDYENIDYAFNLLINETMINFHNSNGLLYNVYIPGKYIVVEKDKFGEMRFKDNPVEDYKYLIAIPI